MTSETASSAVGPVPARQRLASLDMLRGLAVLGLLPMLVFSFATVSTGVLNPPTAGELAGADGTAWILYMLFVSHSFDALLAVTFGASVVLMTRRLGPVRKPLQLANEAKALEDGAPLPQRGPNGVPARRMAALVAMAVLAMVVLWSSVLPLAFALAGWAAYSFAPWRARYQVRVGFLSVALGAAVPVVFGAYLVTAPDDMVAVTVARYWQLDEAGAAREAALLTGSIADQIAWRLGQWQGVLPVVFFIQMFWRMFGFMLIGMALFKWGVLSAALPASRYALAATVGFLVGVPLVTVGVLQNVTNYWSMPFAVTIGLQFDYWGGPFLATTYLSLLMIACKYRMLRRLKSGLKAVGRMPLTNALIQMTVLGWIFYGHGLGLYGTLDRMALLQLSGGFAVIQLVISPFWLRAFRFGPVEWLWRCFAYGRSLNLLHFATIARSH